MPLLRKHLQADMHQQQPEVFHTVLMAVVVPLLLVTGRETERGRM
jgi:hypothetical protein